MSQSIRNYFRRIAEGYEKGFFAYLCYPVLEVASWAYSTLVRGVRFLYEKRLLARKRLPYPVISVGNLVWGGTGKTPFVEYLAKKISERRRTPLILTRGYSHDEVEQFRHHLPKAMIGVGKNRSRTAKSFHRKHRIDVAILDDGFQHWRVEREIELIMINALNPFGNGKVIPRGMLREPLSTLRKAAIAVISHANLISLKERTELRKQLHEVAPDLFIVEACLEPLFFFRAKKRSRVALQRLKNRRVTTFSGVGAPRSFQLVLSRMQIKPVRNFEFTDHHQFSKADLMEVKHVSEAGTAEEIVTTEKDFYRTPKLITDLLDPLVLATRLRILSGEEVLSERLFRLLGVTPR